MRVYFSTVVRSAPTDRGGELVALDWANIDFVLGVVRVARGKGDKQRAVPIGNEALAALERYRSSWCGARLDEATVFLNRRGRRLDVRSVARVLDRCLRTAALALNASPHATTSEGASLLSISGLIREASDMVAKGLMADA